MMGQGMMGGSYGNGGWGSMMSSHDWSWMMGGAWRNMSQQDWHRIQQRWLGTTMMSHHGWSAWTIAAVALSALLLSAALATVVVRRRPFRRAPATSSPE